MKITIDTKEDSHEEIKKAIEFLQSLSGTSTIKSEPMSDMLGFFDAPKTESKEELLPIMDVSRELPNNSLTELTNQSAKELPAQKKKYISEDEYKIIPY